MSKELGATRETHSTEKRFDEDDIIQFIQMYLRLPRDERLIAYGRMRAYEDMAVMQTRKHAQ